MANLQIHINPLFRNKPALNKRSNWLIKRESCHHIETSQLIKANQLTGFYMMVTLAVNELMANQCNFFEVHHENPR